MEKLTKKRSFGAATIAGVIAICLCFYLFSALIYENIRTDLGGYTEVNGVVLDSFVKGTTAATAGSSRTVAYKAIVKYSYEVDDTTYQSSNSDSNIFTRTSSERGGRADEVVQKYRPGTQINVWYKNDDPSVSIVDIERKATINSILIIMGFLLFGVFCILYDRWYIGLRESQS